MKTILHTQALLFITLLMNANLLYSQSGWESQTSGTTLGIVAVWFMDENTGIAVGGDVVYPWDPGSCILRTTDGGTTWSLIPNSAITYLFGLCFADSLNGWATGNEGVILRTRDGGKSWTEQASMAFNGLYDVSCADTSNVWVVGEQGTIKHSSDGGNKWSSQVSKTITYLYDVSFLDVNTGIVAGWNGTILRTTDGGITWNKQQSGTTNHLKAVAFCDSENGIVVGEYGTILRTNDGGITWTAEKSGDYNNLWGAFFYNADVAIAVGENGTILRTTNGGVNWTRQPNISTNLQIADVFLSDVNTGVAVGLNGQILRINEGTSVEEILINDTPNNASLSQNYPNPFNRSTNIEFQISVSNLVSLKVYTSNGQEMETLVNKKMEEGNYIVNWDASNFQSGIYYYILKAGSLTESRKLVLMR